jgi:hypothetical protein
MIRMISPIQMAKICFGIFWWGILFGCSSSAKVKSDSEFSLICYQSATVVTEFLSASPDGFVRKLPLPDPKQQEISREKGEPDAFRIGKWLFVFREENGVKKAIATVDIPVRTPPDGNLRRLYVDLDLTGKAKVVGTSFESFLILE